jgi:hypothetical protein
MNERTFARWLLRYDPDATRHAYRQVTQGGAEQCGCAYCLNFAAQRERVYPHSVLELFKTLGIDAAREVEVFENGPAACGQALYMGWFHFVGEIVSERPERKETAEKGWGPDLEPIGDSFEIGFSDKAGLVRKPSEGLPIVQLDFALPLDWVLDTPCPWDE